MDKNDIVDGEDQKEEGGKQSKRIDLSLTQVLGSAVATVVAAFLAGQLGVYGTFIGAGVVSLVATSGGPIFQHLFRRTGEQIKEATVQAKPRTRQLPVRDPAPGWKDEPQHGATNSVPPGQAPSLDGPAEGERDGDTAPPDQVQLLDTSLLTQMLPQAGAPGTPGRGTPGRGTPGEGQDDATRVLRVPGGDDATRVLRTVEQRPAAGPGDPGGPEDDEEFSAATTHGTRWRGWRRTLLPALIVFVIAIGGITVYEAASGNSFSGGKGTSISHVFRHSGSSGGGSDSPSVTPSPSGSSDGDDGSTGPQDGDKEKPSSPGTGDEATPGSGDGDGRTPSTGTGTPSPGSTPSGDADDPDGSGDRGDTGSSDDTGDGSGSQQNGSEDTGNRQQAPQSDPSAG